MSHSSLMLEKATAFDKVKVIRTEVDKALTLLKELRQKYPFTQNLRSIEYLDPDRLFKINPDEIGEFFILLEGALKPYGRLTYNTSNIYRNTRLQISEFKNLLRTAVDSRKSLAQKVDAPWERIGGVGQDKELAKEIIFCFNCESGTVLPIFSNQHLRHFLNRVADAPIGQTKYFSLGQEYEHYTLELLKAKNSLPLTQAWSVLYFTSFLYQTYPPPDSEKPTINPNGEGKTIDVVSNDQLELRAFVKLLGDLQSKGKITGQEFRENRELWMRQQPNDRDVTIWRLKKLLNTEAKINPEQPKSQPLQKRRL